MWITTSTILHPIFNIKLGQNFESFQKKKFKWAFGSEKNKQYALSYNSAGCPSTSALWRKPKPRIKITMKTFKQTCQPMSFFTWIHSFLSSFTTCLSTGATRFPTCQAIHFYCISVHLHLLPESYFSDKNPMTCVSNDGDNKLMSVSNTGP